MAKYSEVSLRRFFYASESEKSWYYFLSLSLPTSVNASRKSRARLGGKSRINVSRKMKSRKKLKKLWFPSGCELVGSITATFKPPYNEQGKILLFARCKLVTTVNVNASWESYATLEGKCEEKNEIKEKLQCGSEVYFCLRRLGNWKPPRANCSLFSRSNSDWPYWTRHENHMRCILESNL